MNHNGARSPDEIVDEIGRTREEMHSTLNAIEQRLTPGQLFDHGLDYLRKSGGGQFVSNLGESAKQNPLPVALAGIGLAWLMASGKQGTSQTGATSSALSEKTRAAKQRLSEGMQSARERMHGARERAAELGHSAQHQMERTRSGIDYMMREQPLALGAIGLAIGAVLAAAAPRTKQEDRVMGEARDRLAEKAKQIGKGQLEKAEHVAGAAKQAATGRAAASQPSIPRPMPR